MLDYAQNLIVNLDEIGKLIKTPEFMKEQILSLLTQITDLNPAAERKIENAQLAITNISQVTLKSNYEIIYNQMCVLAVSALNAILEECFNNYVTSNKGQVNFNFRKNEVRLNLQEISKYGFNLKSKVAKILMDKDEIVNFQNIDNTLEALNGYCNKKITVPEELKRKILFYQQCRHIIVHKNSIADEEFIEKIQYCNSKNYKDKDRVQLDSIDWDEIQTAFPEFVRLIQDGIRN